MKNSFEISHSLRKTYEKPVFRHHQEYERIDKMIKKIEEKRDSTVNFRCWSLAAPTW